MQAVILAAGYGLRLRPFTETAPKGLVPILGKPLLEWTLESLPKNIDEIIIVTGWLGNLIESKFGSAYNGLPIKYVQQEPINGTGSALHFAKDLLHNSFLIVNGDDIYTPEDLTLLINSPSWGMLATSTTRPLPGALRVNGSDIIEGLEENTTDAEKWVNCGAYITDMSIFDLPLAEIPVRDKIEYSLPHTLIQDPEKRPVRLFRASQWLPIGTPEELAKAESLLG